MSKFEITKQEIIFAIVLAICGYIFTMTDWLKFLGRSTPLQGFLIYYGIIFVAMLILARYGLAFSPKIKDVHQVIGVVLILFAFFLVFNWENPYVQYVTMGHLDGASPAFYGTEDGVTWDFWYTFMGVTNLEYARLLSFVFTPFILSLLGGYLAAKPKLNLL